MNLALLMLASLHLSGSAQPPARELRTLCLRDSVSRAPLVAVVVQYAGATTPRPLAGACTSLIIGDSGRVVRVERVGYHARTAELARTPGQHDTIWIALAPGASRTTPAAIVLDTQRVRARATTPARASATVAVSTARERGARSITDVIGQLPYTTLRSARGETGVSMRGARREQVVVTLDGLPLNDPATGIADVSDIPLVSLHAATSVPGADPLGAGAGATGGVLALTTAAQRTVALQAGAFGEYAAEGAWSGVTSRARWHAALAWRDARNDFSFINDAGAAEVRETRVNNDLRRATLSAGIVGTHLQLSLLASATDRGMVGPANVRSYDADRARTDRLVTRAQWAVGSTIALAGVRWFTLTYRDPNRPAFDTHAQAWAGDVEWRGQWQGQRAQRPDTPRSVQWPTLVWRAGVGGDGLTGTGNVTQQRRRAFGSLSAARDANEHRVAIDGGVRLDVIEGAGAQPTATVGTTVRVLGEADASSRLHLRARIAQAVRVPTLYDLYFSSPQRLFVRALRPEHVAFDGDMGAEWQRKQGEWRFTLEGTLVARETRDAIIWFPGNFGWSPANVGRDRLRGFEARTAVSRHAHSLSGWVTQYASTVLAGGLRIPTPYVPRTSIGAEAHWRVHASGARATSLTAALRHQGPRPYTAGPRNPDFDLPAVSLLDLAIGHHQPWHRADALVTLSMNNVTGARWQSVRGFPMPGRAWSIGLTLQHSPR
jgi:outer membrane cobalamin receptor